MDVALLTDPASLDLDQAHADVSIDGRDLRSGDDLATAVTISLFTWARALPDDPIEEGGDRFGWWGDTFPAVPGGKIGSRLYLLLRAKLTDQTVELARVYAQEALAWLVEDRVATRVEVEAERDGQDRLNLAVTVYRADGTSRPLRFDNVWEWVSNG